MGAQKCKPASTGPARVERITPRAPAPNPPRRSADKMTGPRLGELTAVCRGEAARLARGGYRYSGPTRADTDLANATNRKNPSYPDKEPGYRDKE